MKMEGHSNLTGTKTLEDCRLNVSRDFNFADDQIRKQYIKTNQYFERVLNEDGRSF